MAISEQRGMRVAELISRIQTIVEDWRKRATVWELLWAHPVTAKSPIACATGGCADRFVPSASMISGDTRVLRIDHTDVVQL